MGQFSPNTLNALLVRAQKRSSTILLVGIILLAFLIRLVIPKDQPLLQDGLFYAMLGKQLIAGHFAEGLSAYWPPLYPALIGLFSLVFRDLEVAGVVVSVIAGSLVVVPTYFLSLELYGKKTAAWAALLVGISPALISVSTRIQVESTYTLFFITAIYLGLGAVKGKIAKSFTAGLAFGACYLLKPEAIAYVGLMLILIYAGRFVSFISFSRITGNALLFLLGFVLLAAPYLIYIHQTTHHWVISEKLVHLSETYEWRKLDESKQGTLADKVWEGRSEISEPSKKGFDVKLSYAHFAKKMAGGLIPVITRTVKLLPKLLIPFLLLGLITGWSRERAFKELFVVLFIVSTLFGYAFIPITRYLLPILPLLLCWIAKGIVEFEEVFTKLVQKYWRPSLVTSNVRWGAIAIIIAIFAITTVPSLIYQFRNSGRGLYWEQKQVAEWIKENSAKPPLILSTKNWPTFYAGGEHLFTPDETYPVIIDYAKRKKVDFLVVEEEPIDVTPNLKFLLNKDNTAELSLVYSQDQIPGYKILVYKVVS